MKLTTFFISRTKQIYAKTLTISENTFKIKTMSPWALLEILLTSAIICKQRFLHENEIVQYLKNCKYKDIKLSKSVYMAKSRQRYHKTLANILLHLPNHVLKDLQMFNHGIIKNANKLYYTRFLIIFLII